MFRCTVCNKLYTTEIRYCECGNDEFVYVVESQPQEQFVKSRTKNSDPISLVAFAICILLSLSVLFLYNPSKSNAHKSTKQRNAVAEDVQKPSIPSIDEIWDDTPPYGSSVEVGNDLDVYKKSLQNLLNSNIQPKQYSGNGRCDIEFHVSGSGKLVNRKMFKKEGDKEFNNIVLNMLKTTTKHRVPPADYLGEKIRGEVIVQDGIIKLYIK